VDITNTKGIPLQDVKEIPQDIVDKLRELSITTCEEFVSAIHAQPDEYGKFLKIDKQELLKFHNIVKKRLPSQLVKELEEQGEKFVYADGVPSPYSDEFLDYLHKEGIE
jgi:hypothetical protein